MYLYYYYFFIKKDAIYHLVKRKMFIFYFFFIKRDDSRNLLLLNLTTLPALSDVTLEWHIFQACGPRYAPIAWLKWHVNFSQKRERISRLTKKKTRESVVWWKFKVATDVTVRHHLPTLNWISWNSCPNWVITKKMIKWCGRNCIWWWDSHFIRILFVTVVAEFMFCWKIGHLMEICTS